MNITNNAAKDISMTDNAYVKKEVDKEKVRKSFYDAKYCPLCPKNKCIINGDIEAHLLQKHKEATPSDILKIIVDEQMNVFGEICEEIFFLKCVYDIIAKKKTPNKQDKINMQNFKENAMNYVNNMTCDAI